MKPHEPGVEQSICLGETPNQTNYEGDGMPSRHQIGMCFWTLGSHMSYMGQGPFHYVSDITGSHSPASSPLVVEIPLGAVFPGFLHHQRLFPGWDSSYSAMQTPWTCRHVGRPIHEAS